MKIKAAPSEIIQVSGEEERSIPNPEPGENKDHFKSLWAKENEPPKGLMAGLVKEGKWLRAVVVWTGLLEDTMVDPRNWGIVTTVNPHSNRPLGIHWCSGVNTTSDGSDIKVIWRHYSKGDMLLFSKVNGDMKQ